MITENEPGALLDQVKGRKWSRLEHTLRRSDDIIDK